MSWMVSCYQLSLRWELVMLSIITQQWLNLPFMINVSYENYIQLSGWEVVAGGQWKDRGSSCPERQWSCAKVQMCFLVLNPDSLSWILSSSKFTRVWVICRVVWLFDFLNKQWFQFFKKFRIKEPSVLVFWVKIKIRELLVAVISGTLENQQVSWTGG